MYATIDIETTGLNRYKDKITFIGVGLAEDVGQPIHKKFVYNWQDEKAHERFYNLCNNLRKRKVRTVFQNGKFDTLFIEQHTGIRLPIHEDVMLMATAYDLAAEHGLKAMAKRYLGVPDWDISKKKKLSGDPDEVVPYLEKDVLYTWDLFCFFMKRMNGQQDKIYRQLLRPAYLMYRNVERNGAYIDVKGLSSVREKYKRIEEEKLDALNSRYKINWNSSGQVAKVLFEDEGLPVYKKSAKTGKPSADAEVLKKLASKGHQIPQLLLEYKAANTLNKMFLCRWEDDLAPDRRIHSTYSMTNVVTGRTSCLIGETQIMVPSGYKPIKDITIGELVYCFDGDRPTLSKVAWSGCTGVRSDLYRVYYNTQGEHSEQSITLTGDHLVKLTTGEFVRADSLAIGDRVMAIHRGVKDGRHVLYFTGNTCQRENIFVFSELNGYTPEHVHHLDGDKLNDVPENLIGMTAKEHTSYHAKQLPNEEYARRAKFSHNDNWRSATAKANEERLKKSMTKQELIDLLMRYNGAKAAAKAIGRDPSYIWNRMAYYGVKYDGRKSPKARLQLTYNHYITRVEKLNVSLPVYDLTVEKTHNFIAGELCVHNCQNPNLQQVPRNKDVRGLFIAPKGRVFFEADYSQLELRIAADYANEKTMIEIYRTGGDIHTETARLMTGGREPTKEERSKAKAVNFGFLYGMQAKKFVSYAYNSYNTVFTNAEAEQFRALFFAKYSRLLPWHKEMEEMCEALGGVANKFGRFRKLPNIYSQQKFERLSAVRRAINTPVQGTGSDLLISAATQLMKEHSKNGLTIVGTVHDSILGEFWAEDEEWMVPEIKRIMAHPAIMDEFGVTLKVPLEADVGIGPWGSK